MFIRSSAFLLWACAPFLFSGNPRTTEDKIVEGQLNILELDIGQPTVKLHLSLSITNIQVHTQSHILTHLCNIDDILPSIAPITSIRQGYS